MGLDELARALKIARAMTEDSRKHNRERLARKANARQISPGDSVIIKSEARVTLPTLDSNPSKGSSYFSPPPTDRENQSAKRRKMSNR